MTVAEYRTAMLASKAAKAGVTVAELLARSEAEAMCTRRVNELRYGVPRVWWPVIARKAAAHGRRWTVLVL